MSLRIHFISGLPRSGSTLLAAILRQNPKFRAGVSSPLCYVYVAAQNAMGGRNDYSYDIDNETRQRVLRGVVENYYHSAGEGVTIFDTNRLWTARISGISTLFPDCKVICCVRSLAWIFDSFERFAQKNPFQPSGMFGFDSAGNYLTRIEALNQPTAQVGAPYQALKEAFYGEHSNRLLLVRFESLTSRPKEVLARIYDFIAEKPFQHEFAGIAFEAEELDRRLGMPGLHRIRPVVEPEVREPILPADVYARFQAASFWDGPAPNPRGVKVI